MFVSFASTFALRPSERVLGSARGDAGLALVVDTPSTGPRWTILSPDESWDVLPDGDTGLERRANPACLDPILRDGLSVDATGVEMLITGSEGGLRSRMELRGVEVVEEDALGESMLRLGLENTEEIRRERGRPVPKRSELCKLSSVAKVATRSCIKPRIWVISGLRRSNSHSIIDQVM